MLKDFSKENFDIFIQAGQSNSQGCGVGAVEEPYVKNDQVWYMNADFTISCAYENVFRNEIQGNFALPFAREYIKKRIIERREKTVDSSCSAGWYRFS